MSQQQPKLPPIGAIELDDTLKASTEKWFEYFVKAQPHHTDYGGVVWHGTYLTWMEEARVECLHSVGVDFANLVKLGCDLPVVEMSLRYHRPIRLGMSALVKTRMEEIDGVRINWDYNIQSPDGEEIYLTGKVTLVVVDREKGKIMRQIPPSMRDALSELPTVKRGLA
jgi:acyl-CoA thioester hydrolase